ncbi:MAG: acyl-CoA dehydratase activase-related protein [Christensenellales bacterium]|jgi:predicted CoA-substrate-specific enzyme activase
MAKYQLGVDIGSTTIKLVLLKDGQMVYEQYRRHLSDIQGELARAFEELAQAHPGVSAQVAVTGSGGLLVARSLGLDFIQEVVAGTQAVQQILPDTDVIIELGGEDAKITYLKPSLEQRMNGTCAGGTGAFIDQMAALLKTDASGLNALSERHRRIYPIASRCGVFAKSDMQPLLNEGAPREDLAASVLQAVVNQTIAGLAQGRPIRGNVVFLGGPLHFLPQLRERFEKTLKGEGMTFTAPEKAQLFVALGAAQLAGHDRFALSELADKLQNAGQLEMEIQRMPPLFASAREQHEFETRHSGNAVARAPIAQAAGPCYLGIDAGSTTIKAALIDQQGRLLYQYYANNQGSPLYAAIDILKELYGQLPQGAYIARSCVTGYGEKLIQTALKVDEGEIETMAHYKAAAHFCPGVTFIIDIGGQDMKCMRIKDGVIDSIMLNEACSSGCGSFIQTFAQSLGLSVQAFAQAALSARNPVDLGTRCTVFMNSRVKQAQKEGAGVGDISAGLSYSVVRNALYKVIKLKDPAQMGEKVVVQGGTFLNEAILRCFEQVSGKQVIRPDIAGLMGAFGSALLARDRCAVDGRSTLLDPEQLAAFHAETKLTRCGGCTNNCQLTIVRFGDGQFISGNRCEKGGGGQQQKNDLPDLFTWKYQRLFAYTPLPAEKAPRGEMGIPRCLNLYENYPLWFTFFTQLGYRVVLSGRSDHKLFERGMDTIPSESVCYPAKLAHGHISQLIDQGVGRIFYPSIPYEHKEYQGANNHYNCPIVTSYPEVIANNVDAIAERGVQLLHPFLNLTNPKSMARELAKALAADGVTRGEIKKALAAARQEMDRFHAEVRAKGEETLRYLQEHDLQGIVLAGRPYHLDPEIHHGIPQTITQLGLAVLTEDSVAHLGQLPRPIRVVDQWAYHTRLYEAANFVARTPYLELVQLNSFGCGIDAITTDQVQEILAGSQRIYTLLKIDEISSLGTARIRLRSLRAAMLERKAQGYQPHLVKSPRLDRVIFTEQMRAKHTIIAPQMSPLHFKLLEKAFNLHGYDFHVLHTVSPQDVETGLKFVNNDACYPSIMVVGQLVNAFLSGQYDPDNTTVCITQTGGGCRATNYIAFLRKALADAGYSQVPVVSLNFAGMEKNPGFKLSAKLLLGLGHAVAFGDLLQQVTLRTRPYEVAPGSADALCDKWLTRLMGILSGDEKLSWSQAARGIVADFDNLPIHEDQVKPRVGLVGEILVKFHPQANNDAIGVIESEGGEAVMPGLMGFLFYCVYNNRFKTEHLGFPKINWVGGRLAIWFLERLRKSTVDALRQSKRFEPPARIEELAQGAETVLSTGNCTGEGWFLTAEMIELIQSGVPNIICAQPFACLPNHVTGKGMIKRLRKLYPLANVVPVDYDPGASEVNQLNRIKLMVATAFRNLEGAKPQPAEPERDEKPASA